MGNSYDTRSLIRMIEQPASILFLFHVPMVAHEGGVQRVTETLSKEFRKNGIECLYISLSSTSNTNFQFSFPDSRKWDTKRNVEFLTEIIRKKNVKIVIWQLGLDTPCVYATLIKRLGVKLFSCFHGPLDMKSGHILRKYTPGIFRTFKLWQSKRKMEKIWKFNLKNTDKTILLCKKEAEKLAKIFPEEKSKIEVIHNPTPFSNEATRLPAKEKQLLFVGRFEDKAKQISLLIKIWEKVYSDFPDWELILVGDGPSRETIETYINDHAVKRVRIKGFCDPIPFYRDASVFCLTSASEGFPMVLVEAASYGCVPVAFDSFSSVHDIISDEHNGMLVPAFALTVYAEKLRLLMSNEDFRTKLALTAKAESARFSSSKIAARWIELFDNAKKQ